jgi:hypothetical protein
MHISAHTHSYDRASGWQAAVCARSVLVWLAGCVRAYPTLVDDSRQRPREHELVDEATAATAAAAYGRALVWACPLLRV